MKDRVHILFEVAPRGAPGERRPARLRVSDSGEVRFELPAGEVRLRAAGPCVERYVPGHVTTLRGDCGARPATVVVHCGLTPPGLFVRAGEARYALAITHEDQDRLVAGLRALRFDPVAAAAADRVQLAV